MTFSIVGRCARTGRLGVAVSTKVPAVGMLCPFARPGVGAIATQSFVNPYLGLDGLDLLAQGSSAQETLDRLVADDPGREVRQLGVVDRAGRSAAFSGRECVGWFGHQTGADFAAQGNMLVGAATVDALAATFAAHPAEELPERLVRALEAGQAAGGDKRGRQSAALYVVDRETAYAYLDLRVDEHPDPVAELRRVFEVAKDQLMPFLARLPTREHPLGRPDRAAVRRRPPAEEA